MFQLIVAVISIALVAALAIASIYYGGKAFNQGTLKANVTTLVNAGQQISGAQALYLTEKGTGATAIESLYTTGDYLSGAPALSSIADGSGWQLVSSSKAYVKFKDGVNVSEVCGIVAQQAGAGLAPQFYCSDATGAQVSTGATGFTYKL